MLDKKVIRRAGESGRPDIEWYARPDESFTQAAAQEAKSHPSQTAAMIREMLRKEEAGSPVFIPEGTDGRVVNERASQAELMQALAATMSRAGGVAAPPATPGVSAGLSESVAAGFPERGEACGSNRAWCQLKLAIAADYCNPDCELEDEITARLTVNPGANEVSKVSWTSIYSPNSGDFQNVHFEWYTMVYSWLDQCGTANTPDINANGSGLFYPTCSQTTYGYLLTHGFRLWGYLIPSGEWIDDQARTGSARCAGAGR